MMQDREVEANETSTLIGSDKVEGTTVYGPDRNRIGKVERVMLEKRSGKAAYAVISFGGFLGIGERRHPLPWDQLTYDTSLDGYVCNVSRDTLEGAPSYDRGAEPDWSDRGFREGLAGYYGRGGMIPPVI